MDKRKNNNNDAVENLSGDIEVRNGMEVYCIGLENIPVTNAELDVLETYASDLIRILVTEHMNKQRE
ncbi:hypothetical protein MNBD_ALPHA03-470 [hydrothermal vent metagenome]|uniref:Uncharacterized protein n=1 Tax=hydrothermal vent metagenome TaxID=652676 RepID=A0A3B1AJQ9_9ZZZZ